MKSLLFLFCILGYGASCFAQHQRLLYHSNEIGKSDSLTIKRIRPQTYGKSLVVKYQDGTKKKILKVSLWGYTNRKGHIFRLYKNHAYRAIMKDDFIKYVYHQNRYTYTIYSKTWDSEVVKRKKKL